MNNQKVIIAVVVSTIFIFALDSLWYMVLMKDYFTPIAGMREVPDMVWLIVGTVIYSIGFVLLYVRCAGNGTRVSEGMTFGFLAALLAYVSMGFIWYSILENVSGTEFIVDTIYRVVQMMVLGILVANITGLPGGDRSPGLGKGAGGGDA